jgi:predicted dehydrogenase
MSVAGKKRFAVIGLGNRGMGAFCKGILGSPGKGLPEFAEHAELAAICDANSNRVKVTKQELNADVGTFTDLAAMLAEAEFETLVIVTRDSTHRDIAVQALEAGKNVVCEKPMATTVEACDRMIAAAEANGRQLRIAQNARYRQGIEEVAKLIFDGAVGRPMVVVCQEHIDVGHGSDYFHRWHRRKENSGGLLLHYCSHSFDWLNWIIGGQILSVAAMGDKGFYVPRQQRGERCDTCGYKEGCKFFYDLRGKWDGLFKRMYMDGEPEDGYIRDGCVWDPQINIEDRMMVIGDYDNGTKLSFTLSTFSSGGSDSCVVIGSDGRLEYAGNRIVVQRMHEKDQRTIELKGKQDGHAGPDIGILRSMILGQDAVKGQTADGLAGRAAVLLGSMANKAIAEKRVVTAGEFGKPGGAGE